MSNPEPHVPAPAWVDRLLDRMLPSGPRGRSIIADLHQELDEIVASGGRRFPRAWYVREALRLAVRYGALRVVGRGKFTREREPREEIMTTMWADVRYGFRMLWKTPGLSFIAVLTIALGVGFTTHTYSTVYGGVVRGLPVPEKERLVHIDETLLSRGITSMEMPLHDYLDLREQQTVFTDVAAYYQGTVNLAGDEAPPERFAGAFMTANALELVGVAPLMGRTFVSGEDAPEAPPRVVLSYHTWQNRFNGDPGIIGKTVRANGLTTEIIGVMPEGHNFPFREDVWLTHRMNPVELERRAGQDLDVFGRLREGVSRDAARAELAAIAGRLGATYPEDNEGVGFDLRPYAERFMPAEITAVMWLMLGATFGVLLIACANVANLLLARSSIRAREVAIRTAMGASRGRIIRQLLAEATVLAVVGGVLGLGIAYAGVETYNLWIADIERPYWLDFRIDRHALLFAFGVTGLASIVAGTLPALRASGLGMGEILKDEGRGSSSLRMGRLSTALVVGEIAMSCSLLIAAGLMIKSVANLRNVDLGFEPEAVLVARLGLFEGDYPEAEDRSRFFQALHTRLAGVPGVARAALGTSVPALGTDRWYMSVEGKTYLEDLDYPVANGTLITEGYFDALGVSFVSGRDFRPGEVWDPSDPVAIVNESFVATVLEGREPIGARVRLGRGESGYPWMRIVGVVPDLHVGGNVGGLGDDREDPEHIYAPAHTFAARFMNVVLRTQGPPLTLAPALREVVAELDRDLPIYDVAPMNEAIRAATWAFGMFGSLFTLFGAAALFMAAVGLYGVMSFSVNQRRQEMGVRMALGAGPEAILAMVLRRGMGQLAIGVALGLVLGFAMTRPMAVVTYDVDLADPTVYLAIVLTLSAAGLAACWFPARSATRADPVEAMRPQ